MVLNFQRQAFKFLTSFVNSDLIDHEKSAGDLNAMQQHRSWKVNSVSKRVRDVTQKLKMVEMI